jgi:undecaprenyl diphosphate synthase
VREKAEPGALGPRHLAIIMDGNGRWARARGKTRTAGHRQGAEAARRVVRAAARIGIPYLTLFAFSSENWKRSAREVDELMWLLRTFIQRELDSLDENDVRVRVIGDRSALPEDLQDMLVRAERRTDDNRGLGLTLALNYGGRQDIARTARALARAAANRTLDADRIDLAMFAGALSTAVLPDPDLLVRTSGEKRISNFLLWECAEAELVFVDKLWPDVGADDLRAMIEIYRQRASARGAENVSSSGPN